jgi:hypothetical protein
MLIRLQFRAFLRAGIREKITESILLHLPVFFVLFARVLVLTKKISAVMKMLLTVSMSGHLRYMSMIRLRINLSHHFIYLFLHLQCF